MKKIAIIGAGISGMYLANILKNYKEFDYKIFEKKIILIFPKVMESIICK